MYIIPTLIFVVRKMTFDIPTHSVGSRVMAAALLLWLLKTDVSRINGLALLSRGSDFTRAVRLFHLHCTCTVGVNYLWLVIWLSHRVD